MNGEFINSIGHTEILRLGSIVTAGSADVYAKCEFRNPTGSHKDRVFHYMLAELENQGVITPGMTLVECSTGNGGAALAQVGRMHGYKIVIVMPRGMTIERKMQISSLGATIIETAPEGFLEGAESVARDYVRKHRGSHFLDQSTNEMNWKAWRVCGNEIVQFFREQGRTVDVFVCSLGTGGTFSGIADRLKAAFPKVHTIAVEVDRSAPLYAQRNGLRFEHHSHNLIGLGPGKIPPNVRQELIDEVRVAPGAQGWTTMKELVDKEQIFVGPTAGTNVFIAKQVAAKIGASKAIVTVLFDSAWKYFSVWDGQYSDYPAEGEVADTVSK